MENIIFKVNIISMESKKDIKKDKEKIKRREWIKKSGILKKSHPYSAGWPPMPFNREVIYDIYE